MAIQGIGLIGLNVDELKEKSKDYQEFVILEEFCHLLDDKGDSRPNNSQRVFIQDCSKQQKFQNVNLTNLAHSLSDNFVHYDVNKLLMKFDFEKWIKYRKGQYDKQLRQRTPDYYETVSNFTKEQGSVIMITQMLMVISFVRAVESFLSENNAILGRKSKLKLQQIVSSHYKTIYLLQKYTERLGIVKIDILNLFSNDIFADETLYFEAINKLLIESKLFN